ncbi:MAG: hypothetical protein HYU68_13655 [Bacteroidetes bacterium]|nr:hypothetical protein [Bacteroidota bacterium]
MVRIKQILFFIIVLSVFDSYAQEPDYTSKGNLVFSHNFWIKSYVGGNIFLFKKQLHFTPNNSKKGLPKVEIPLNEIDTVLDLFAASFKIRTVNGSEILLYAYVKKKKEFIKKLREYIIKAKISDDKQTKVVQLDSTKSSLYEIIESSITIYPEMSILRIPITFNGKFKLEREKMTFFYQENDYIFSEFELKFIDIEKIKERRCKNKFVIIDKTGMKYRFKSNSRQKLIDFINGKKSGF